MKYDRVFLKNVHEEIKTSMYNLGFMPHRNPACLISHFDYGCNFYTLRYWRKQDTEFLFEQWYNQSCLELLVYNNRLFIGIWFGKNNKNLKKLNRIRPDVIAKCGDYPDYSWIDQNEKSANPDDELVHWLCDTDHEAAFRKELTDYNRNEVLSEMKHLKEYLDLLLK